MKFMRFEASYNIKQCLIKSRKLGISGTVEKRLNELCLWVEKNGISIKL